MQFDYQVIDRKHKRSKGIIEANSLNEARNILKEKEAFIVFLKKVLLRSWLVELHE